MTDDSRQQTVRIALAQINCTVGDLTGNTGRIISAIREAAQAKADIVLLPELAITGYPPEDLLLRPKFLQESSEALEAVARSVEGVVAVVGCVASREGRTFNAAAVIQNGRIAGTHYKQHLPDYGVFDEERYFSSGDSTVVFQLGGVRFGVAVCEDIWVPDGPALRQTMLGGANLILVPNASPYHRGKWREREAMLSSRARRYHATICYANLVGGQDELVFDGMSVAISSGGKTLARCAAFEEQLALVDLGVPAADVEALPEAVLVQLEGELLSRSEAAEASVTAPPDDVEEVYGALVTGVRDYVRKNGFREVVIGLSGGIDSALTYAIACDALGVENVTGVTMPSRYSSSDTRSDAAELARRFGGKFLTLPIEGVFGQYLELLKDEFGPDGGGLAEENLQSRIRGNLLMALSNRGGSLVLTTGNKSEMATGYATLYGDMAGGFAVLKDVPKTLVWELARHRNADQEMIPLSTIERAPSAELRPDQKDSDSLPPYDVLDPILHQYVELDRSAEEIIESGFEDAVVRRVIAMVNRSEYKRRQAPPGVKITPKAFGRDRRMPITNAFRDW